MCAGQLWPHVSMAATGLVGDQLNPQLAMNKPKWSSDIHLHNFNLGDEPPSISGVKVSPLFNSVQSFMCNAQVEVKQTNPEFEPAIQSLSQSVPYRCVTLKQQGHAVH